jgi:hypothetical protein
MTRIGVALFNYESGGRASDGTYDFTKLRCAFSGLSEPPALILFCEAKNYRDNAGAAKYAAAEALSDELHLPEPGHRPPSDHRLVTAAIDL